MSDYYGFFDFWDKNISDEDKQIAYERCKHISAGENATPEEIITKRVERLKCMRRYSDILYYSKIQHLCVRSGEYVEDDRFVGIPRREWVNCRKEYPTTEEYIEKYGLDPYTDCFHCEKDKQGKLIDEREICNPCNPCIDFEYDGKCEKWEKWFLIFDVKACRYWRHPTNEDVMWHCEEQAIRAWESDTPPKSAGKQQISFYDPHKHKGEICPKDVHRITGDPEKDKYLPKTPNDFKWCVPRWNDQCRFFIIEFKHQIKDDYTDDRTITTSWKFLKKCNQEECDLAEEYQEGSSFNKLARHAKICINRCFNVDNKHAIYPAWEGDLVSYSHKSW